MESWARREFFFDSEILLFGTAISYSPCSRAHNQLDYSFESGGCLFCPNPLSDLPLDQQEPKIYY
jgi:hypothetical protein